MSVFHTPVAFTQPKFKITENDLEIFHDIAVCGSSPTTQMYEFSNFDPKLGKAIELAYQHISNGEYAPWNNVVYRKRATVEALNNQLALESLESTYWAHDKGCMMIRFYKETASGQINRAEFLLASPDGVGIHVTLVARVLKNTKKIPDTSRISPTTKRAIRGKGKLLGAQLTPSEALDVITKNIPKGMSFASMSYPYGDNNYVEPPALTLDVISQALHALPWCKSTAPSDDLSAFLVDSVRGNKLTIVDWPAMERRTTVTFSNDVFKVAPAQLIYGVLVAGNNLSISHVE